MVLIQNFNKNKKLFLTSTDYDEFKKLRIIESLKSITIESRNLTVVEINDPIIGQSYGFGGDDITRLYLLGRFKDDTVESAKLPFDVHVMIPRNKDLSEVKALKDLLNIGWATVTEKV